MKTTMKALMDKGEWRPTPDYTPTERETKDRRALLGSNLFYAPSLEFVELPIPTPADDEILMKVGGAAVCGSDTSFHSADGGKFVVTPNW